MKKKVIISILCFGLIAALLSGCGGKQEVSSSEVVPPGTIKTIQKMSDLQREHLYVETDEGYAEPYWGTVNFDIDNANGSNDKVVWYNDVDWNLIPTVHKGQKVVFRTVAEFDERFAFTKFMDAGYTIGISNLRETDTGRYKYTAAEDTKNLNPYSDAYKTIKFDANVTLDEIGGAPLRMDRISPCGTVMGLEKDKTYEADIYVGSEIQACKFRVDSRALYGAQVNYVSDYEFVKAEIIEISIPLYFNSGYYSVNGFGIFRYVADEKDIETDNFNEYNPDNEAAAEQLANQGHYMINATEEVDIAKGRYVATFTYDDDINEDLLPEGRTANEAFLPSVYLNTGSENIIYFEDVGNNTMEAHYTIEEDGVYPLEIQNIYGRNYQYDFMLEEVEPETETTTVEE